MSDYGFAEYNAHGQGNTRIRVTTDYAKATGADQYSTAGYGGLWLVRSSHFDENFACYINNDGYADYSRKVNLMEFGIVPALLISINGN